MYFFICKNTNRLTDPNYRKASFVRSLLDTAGTSNRRKATENTNKPATLNSTDDPKINIFEENQPSS